MSAKANQEILCQLSSGAGSAGTRGENPTPQPTATPSTRANGASSGKPSTQAEPLCQLDSCAWREVCAVFGECAAILPAGVVVADLHAFKPGRIIRFLAFVVRCNRALKRYVWPV